MCEEYIITDSESIVWHIADKNSTQTVTKDSIMINMTAYRELSSGENFSIKRNREYNVYTGFKIFS